MVHHLDVSRDPLFNGVSLENAWELAVAISPRATVRLQARMADGSFTDAYAATHSIEEGLPDGVWATHLTDAAGNFHFIALDLDGKTPTAAEQARRDRDRIVAWLEEADVEYVVCSSGGRGEGWHIWIALYDGVDHQLVWALRDQLKAGCPSLDTAPLGNLRTGAVRPPWAPHASGGTSTPVAGDLRILTRASTTAQDLVHLTAVIAEDVDALPARAEIDAAALAGLPHDAQGQPHMPGKPRSLSPIAKRQLNTAPAGDASAVMFTILLSMARARYHFADVQAHLAAPGFEHARTTPHPRTPGGRVARPRHGSHSTAEILQRQWRRAVAIVAATKDTRGADESFLGRAQAIVDHVHDRQAAADAQPAVWLTPQGAAARRILDTLHLIAVEAVTADVDASIRLLATRTGLCRESARTALLWLQERNWIQRVAEYSGIHAATWTIDPRRVLHRQIEELRSQAEPPAPQTPSPTTAPRDELRLTLGSRQSRGRHDVFTGNQTLAGNAYARLHEGHAQAAWMLAELGINDRTVEADLDALAVTLGRDGTLERREVLYQLERVLWQWWIGELERMRSTQRNQPALGQPHTWVQWGRFPRRLDGRASFRRAREKVVAMATQVA